MEIVNKRIYRIWFFRIENTKTYSKLKPNIIMPIPLTTTCHRIAKAWHKTGNRKLKAKERNRIRNKIAIVIVDRPV